MDVSDLILDPAAVAVLPQDEVRIDEATFEAAITANGTITQPTAIRTDPQAYWALIGLSGFIQEPGLAVVNHANIRWNIKRTNKKSVYAVSDQNFGRLVNILGPLPTTWYPRGLFRFDPAEDINVEFSLRSGYTWNGGASRVGLVLSFLSVSKKMVEDIQRSRASLLRP